MRLSSALCLLVITACVPSQNTGMNGGVSSAVPQSSAVSSLSGSSESSVVALGYRRPCITADFLPRTTYDPVWGASWNTDAATTTVTVGRTQKGFSVKIPYNPAWGNPDCQLSQFDETAESINFGAAGVFEGGGVARLNSIRFLPVRSEAAALAAANTEYQNNIDQGISEPGAKPSVTTIGRNKAVVLHTSGFCDQTGYEIIGKIFNYQIFSACDLDSVTLQAALESFQIYVE